MAPRVVPEIKTLIRDWSMADLEQLAADRLDFATAEECECHLDRALRHALGAVPSLGAGAGAPTGTDGAS
jgi:hypothetical protein